MNFYDVFEADKEDIDSSGVQSQSNGSDPLGQEGDFEAGQMPQSKIAELVKKLSKTWPDTTDQKYIATALQTLSSHLNDYEAYTRFPERMKVSIKRTAEAIKMDYQRLAKYKVRPEELKQADLLPTGWGNYYSAAYQGKPLPGAAEKERPFSVADLEALRGTIPQEEYEKIERLLSKPTPPEPEDQPDPETLEPKQPRDTKVDTSKLGRRLDVSDYSAKLVAGKGERGAKFQPHFFRMIEMGAMKPSIYLAAQVEHVLSHTPQYADWFLQMSDNRFEILKQTAIQAAQDFIDGKFAFGYNKDDDVYNIKGEEYAALSTKTKELLASKVYQRMSVKESLGESVDTHDKLVATVANYMYVKHPEIFTQHGDGYVMTVVDDVVSKWEQQAEPMQDIKAYALEVMDALGADRTNENRAQVKTDYKGHHLTNADGETVASYSKDADGLKKARNTLYINHKGLNTMKQEGLNEAFEAALEQLSLNESVTINTTTSSEGQDTVTVTATDEDAYELVALLKAAGLPHKADEVQSQIVATPCGQSIEMPVEEEFANEPTDDVMNGDMDHMNTQSGGLNRQKQQYRPAARGDNPMAVNEENLLRGLWDLYKEAK